MTRLLWLTCTFALCACGAPNGGSDGGGDAADGGGDTGGGDTGGGDTGGGDTGGGDADAGSDAATDAGDAGADAGGSGCAANFAGCTTYDDKTGSGDTRAITTSGFTYTPKCMRIKVGQSVTFNVDFASHPLRPACGTANPITATNTGSTASFTFNTAGDYGFHCNFHGFPNGNDMAGSIRVDP